jgi:hypothetical protein
VRNMNGRRSEETLYTAVLLAFFLGLVGLGLIGVPAPLVAAIGAGVAAVAIVLFRGPLERGRGGSSRGRARRQRVPERYVPSVLEGSSMKRRRGVHLGKRRHSAPPLRFR